jgi:hypothetical protein
MIRHESEYLVIGIVANSDGTRISVRIKDEAYLICLYAGTKEIIHPRGLSESEQRIIAEGIYDYIDSLRTDDEYKIVRAIKKILAPQW